MPGLAAGLRPAGVVASERLRKPEQVEAAAWEQPRKLGLAVASVEQQLLEQVVASAELELELLPGAGI